MCNKIKKNKYFVAIMLFVSILLIDATVFAQNKNNKNKIQYKQTCHQRLVKYAFDLLQIECPQIINTDIYNHLGVAYDCGNSWTGTLYSGVYQEDQQDAVYGWNGSFTTCTHFWNADESDISRWAYWGGLFDNAYQKAKVYIQGEDSYGQNSIFYNQPDNVFYDGLNHYSLAKYFTYGSDLFDFYSTGSYWLEKYYIDESTLVFPNVLIQQGSTSRKDMTYQILGRVAHLLGDMNVPAHVHNDAHPSQDLYDDSWITADYLDNHWSEYDALDRGGVIRVNSKNNPLRYLFYTANQVADHFKSDNVDGDPTSVYYNGGDYYEELEDFHNRITYPNNQYCGDTVAKYCIPTAIRTIAGLFHWFAVQTGQIPNYDIIKVPQNYSTIQAAINAASNGQKVRISPGNYTLTSNISIPEGVVLQFDPGASINLNGYYIKSSSVIIDFGLSKSANLISVWNGRILKGYHSSLSQALSTASSGETINLPANAYNISSNLTIPSGVTLQLDPGAVFTFNGSSLIVYGTLYASGVTFQGNGGMGSWGGIFINESLYSSFQSCQIKDAQYGVNIYNGYAGFINSSITNSNYGVYITNYAYSTIGANGVFSGNYTDIYDDATSLPNLGNQSYDYLSFRSSSADHVFSLYPGTIYAYGNFWVACQATPNVTSNVLPYFTLCNDPNPSFAPKNPISDEGTIMFSKKQDGTPLQINKIKEPGMDEVDVANQLFFNKQYAEALPKYQNIVDKYPDNFAGEISLVFSERCLDKLDRKTEISDLLNSISLNKAGKKISKAADLRKVYQFLNSGDIKNAVNQAKDVLKNDDDTTHNKMVLFDLGNIYWNSLNDKTTGETYFRELIKKYPYDILSEMALVTLGEWKPKKKDNKNISLTNINSTELISNFPNPFNPSTTITYNIPKDGQVKLVVYDILGKEVKTLVNEVKPVGSYSVQFDANKLSSGNYYCRIFITPANGEKMIVQQKQMQVLK